MRVPTIAFVVLACVVTGACAGRSPSGTSQSHVSTTPVPAPTAFIDLHGVVSLQHGIAVKRCYTGRPGTKLLNGYSVAFDHDDVVEGGEVLVPDFTGDGTYQESASHRQGISRLLSWVILNVAQSPGFPHGTTLEEKPDTTATITIAQGGKHGHVRFEHYRSLYGKNGDERGGDVFGSITWTCADVTRAATL